MDGLYDFDNGQVGRKTYVSVRGHSRSIPKYKTYRGSDGHNYLRPEYGGSWDGLSSESTYIMPDKAGYMSPIDGKEVSGRAAHRDHMKRHDVIEAGDVRVGWSDGLDRAPSPPVRDDIYRAMAELNR